jgi:hypothetical protein
MSRLTVIEKVRLRALHLLARVALRWRPPLAAKAIVDRAASRMPRLQGTEIASAAVRHLFPSGSCLSRALAIAAAVPNAEVVIGVDAWNGARPNAHAWLEMGLARVDTNPNGLSFPEEIARLPSRDRPQEPSHT